MQKKDTLTFAITDCAQFCSGYKLKHTSVCFLPGKILQITSKVDCTICNRRKYLAEKMALKVDIFRTIQVASSVQNTCKKVIRANK